MQFPPELVPLSLIRPRSGSASLALLADLAKAYGPDHILARMGATVVLAGRDPAKCEAVVARLRRDTGNPAIGYLLADLSSQAEVRALAAEFLRRHERLDVLVNNAGGVFPRRRLSADGIEMTFAQNHLSHFLLTGLLVGALRRGAPSRIVNVSSGGHRRSAADLDDLELRRGCQRWVVPWACRSFCSA